MSDFPYPGLRPFKREETDIFFGRDELSNQLIERLGDTHFLAVVGLSGCGKSSLVRTGLLAGLEGGLLPSAGIHWRIAECTPSVRPFFRLANALLADTALKTEYTAHFTNDTNEAPHFLEAQLRRGPLSLNEILKDSPLPPNTNLLLVVDQFEELFRYYRQGQIDDSAKFVRLLLNSSEHPAVYVVITMRSEFIGDCALFHHLPEAINEGLFLTPRLTREQLRQTIEGPAKVFGDQIEPTLTNLLLNEMSPDLDEKGDIPDKLPVLQHALMRMWNLAKARNPKQATLTLKDYEEIGQLTQALSQHVDEAYTELANLVVPAEPQKVAEILFRRLCERDPARRDTRSPAKLNEIEKLARLPPWQQIVPVIDVFRQAGRHFLIPPFDVELKPDSMIDISHESLIQHWKRLKDWANDEAESANIYRRLEDSACLWEEKRAVLLSGIELDVVLDWYKKEQPTAIWAKRYCNKQEENDDKKEKYFHLAIRFLTESEKEQKEQKEEKRRQQEQQEKEAAQQREWKLKQAWRTAIVAVVGFVVAIGLALWGYGERHQAIKTEKERTISLFESQLTHATLLARNEDYASAKKTLGKTDELETEIHAKRRHARNLLVGFNNLMGGASQQIYQGAMEPLFAVDVSSDGRMLATAGEKNTLVLFDVKNGQVLQRLHGHTDSVKAVVFHPTNQWLASAGYDEKIIFWSLPNGEQIKKWKAPKPVLALAVSPDGKYLASGGKDNHITLWDVKTDKSLYLFEGHEKRISGLAFSPNGEWLASASYDNTARLWHVKNRQASHILIGHTDHVQRVTFSPDGQLLATSSKDTNIHLWEVDSGETLRVLHGHKQTVFDVRFVENGRYLVSASDDRTLRVWDTQYGVTMRILQGHTAGVNGVAVFEGNIFSASDDSTVRRWNTALPYQQTVNLPSEPASTAIAPNANQVAVGFADGVLRLYRLPKPDLLWEKQTAHTDKIKRLAFSSDGTLLVSASFDSTAKLWQVKEGNLLQTFSGHTDKINAIAFSPDDHRVATASFDGQIGLFTIGSEQKRFYQASEEKIKAVSFNKSGTKLLSTSDYEVRLWALKNDSQTLQKKSSDKLMWSVFSPNGQQIASVGRDQSVLIYSTTDKSTLYRLTGHESTIYRIIFSPDGQQVVTASADATLRFWDLHNEGKALFSLRLPTNSGRPVPLWDFDFRCAVQGHCWIAVPLTRGKLMLYELRNIYDELK
jgi:WD40 repeat protein